MKKVAFCTLGCKVNQYETNSMEKLFLDAGYEIVDFSDTADVYVVNTCTVTGVGDKKSRQMLRRAKKTNKDAVVVAVGCMAQVSADKVSSIEEVDVLVGTNQKTKIVEAAERAIEEKKVMLVGDVMHDTAFEDMTLDTFDSKDRAYIKIQDGCNKFCSYCIIPYARGHIRSRGIESIISEAERLVENGFSEVTLTGIHVASYGKGTKHTLTDVIRAVEKVSGIERIRLSSIDPLAFTDDFLNEIVSFKKLCPHFHISLQSGSDEILKAMNRRYTAEYYYDVVKKLRELIPDVSVTTDIITGFPRETEKEFMETYEFLEKIALSGIHVFPYSEREGTPAATFDGRVPKPQRAERAKKIAQLAERQKSEFAQRFVGRVMPVLFESKGKNGLFEGFTPNYIKCMVRTEKNIAGKILPAEMLDEKAGELKCKIIL